MKKRLKLVGDFAMVIIMIFVVIVVYPIFVIPDFIIWIVSGKCIIYKFVYSNISIYCFD